MQQIIVVLIFVAAAFYLGRLIYNQFKSKSSCATGCGKCGAVDFAAIEKELKKKGL
ncbi:FeoB-associated Cys-rich membrane protein [Fulvivirgaceae bacterium PWU20]|uniref:FeoB-associated Cys-rich membrane protein n=1 Tax=Chryseosolibacter indicus TaxID=2782351 RepID=A0ABS5VS68_9BACT|nr:FeoB-associated Cys-rich membrane protein [Chryseosolibacter indicus]